jgi:DNA (cytosine-5)-methyltransferase 1
VSRPRLLDLFCGAGGAAMGYSRAGFDVVGVDLTPQPNYPFEFVQADALDWLHDVLLCQRTGLKDERGFPIAEIDAIHASPPCQRWLGVPRALGEGQYPDLISPTRDLLKQTGLPYVIENVPGAPLDGFVLCGSTFGLPLVRHRRFEVYPDIGLVPSMCHQGSFERGTEHDRSFPFAHGSWRPKWLERVLPDVWPWMTLEESHEAIPPAYTEFIGAQLVAHLHALSPTKGAV